MPGITRASANANDLANNDNMMEIGITLNQFVPELKAFEENTLAEQMGRMAQQEAGDELFRAQSNEELNAYKNEVKSFLVRQNTKTAGFMLWLNRGDPEHLSTTRPTLLPIPDDPVKKIAG